MLLVNLLLLCASALAVPRSQKILYSEEPRDLEQHFEEFIATHGKQYAHEEEKGARFEIFKQNVANINKKNLDPEETAVFVINKYTDLTIEEFEKTHLGLDVNSTRSVVEYEKTPHIQVPEQFDWRKQKAVARVKDQESCGSCWIFSAVGAIEGAYAIKHKEIKEFSEQQILDCKYGPGASGCDGGYPQVAIQYITNAGGIQGEPDYPYKNIREQCKFDAKKVKAKVSKMLAYNLKNEEDTKAFLVKNGPISIAVDASFWSPYGGGIFKCFTTKLGHAVLLVGYGKEGNRTYWIIKNSWGNPWGESGYIKVEYKKGTNPCGMYNSMAAGAQVV